MLLSWLKQGVHTLSFWAAALYLGFHAAQESFLRLLSAWPFLRVSASAGDTCLPSRCAGVLPGTSPVHVRSC